MSEDVNVLSQKVTDFDMRLDVHEKAVGSIEQDLKEHHEVVESLATVVNTILSRVERLEEARANAAKPIARVAEEVDKGALMVEVEELKKRLATTQAEYRRVEEERNASWASERTLRNKVCEAGAKCEQALRDAAETKKLLEDARREVQSHAKDRSVALANVDSLTRELMNERCRATALREKAVALESESKRADQLERDLAKAREDRASERRAKERSFEVNERLKKQIEDLQVALSKAREDLAEARKETPAGVQDQFRMEKLGRLFDSLFAHEDALTDETREFWMSLETAGWLRPSRVAELVNLKAAEVEAAQAELKKFKTDENTLRAQLLERVQYLEKALANLSTAHEGLLADKEKAFADKEHAVCPYCHRCATCGTA